MTKQELINLTNLENFEEEFDKVESYIDSSDVYFNSFKKIMKS